MKFDKIYEKFMGESKSNLTNTPQFKNWFKKSKVSSNGSPLIVYHGTDNEFTTFNRKKGVLNDAGWLGTGYYFYGVKDQAEQYGKMLKEVYLSIQNPYFATDEDMENLSELDSVESSKKFTKNLQNQGYDGVYYNGDLREEWVAFEPTQIKSTENDGSFDKSNPNIYK